MPKTLRILCFTLLVIVGCGQQREATVSTALPHIAKVDPIEATTSTSTSTTTTSTTIFTSTTLVPETTTTVNADVEYSVETRSESWPWDVIAHCESGEDWSSTKGYYEGGLQFSPSTWKSYVAAGKSYGLVGYPAHAYQATREMQITVAIRVRDGVPGSSGPYLNPQGYGAWPVCRHRAGV